MPGKWLSSLFLPVHFSGIWGICSGHFGRDVSISRAIGKIQRAIEPRHRGNRKDLMARQKPKRRNLKYVGYDKRGRMIVRVPYKKGDTWTAIERRVDSEDEALEKITEIKRELGMHGSRAFDGEKLSFRELMDRYLVAFPKKADWYKSPPVEFFGDRKIRSLTYGDCKQFKDARVVVKHKWTGKPRSIATVNRELEILRAILKYAHNHGWLKFNPFTAGPALIQKRLETRRSTIPTAEEEDRLIAACVGRKAHIKLIVIATLDTGLRRGALQEITWADVDWKGRIINIPPSANINKERPPFVGISSRLYAGLRTAYGDGKPATARVFGNFKNFKKAYKSVCIDAGIEGLRFNDLRHGYATKLMLAGVPQHLAMKMSGHSNPEIHGIYTNADINIAREVRDALDRFHNQRVLQPTESATIQ